MNTKRTVRAVIDAFRFFIEDKKGRPNRDRHYPTKLLYYYIRMHVNNALTSDRYKKFNAGLNQNLKITIPCVELMEMDIVSDCPCAPHSGCTWMRSRHPIPELLKGKLEFVGTLNGKHKFDFKKWSNYQITQNSRMVQQRNALTHTTRKIGSDTFLYIYNNSEITKSGMLSNVTIEGVFKDPLAVKCFPQCGKTLAEAECGILDTEFNIPDELEAIIFQNAFNSLFSNQRNNVALNPIQDIKNDSLDEG